MKKARVIGLVVIILMLVVGAVFLGVGYFKPKSAGILIESTPAASVMINGEQVGRTPYKETMDVGDVTLKLVPESFDKPLAPYETTLMLVSGIETVVRWDFADSEEKSAGETLSFEKVGSTETSLSIVTIPDSAQILIDGVTRAFAPYKTTSLSQGKHDVVVSAPGYKDRVLSLKTHKGYKLTAVIKLSPSNEPVPVPTQVEEEEKEENVEMVEISETPTGFLRVRSEPSTLGEEVAQVEPGEQYELLDEDDKTGWYKIKLEIEGDDDPEFGWISNQYAEKVDNEDTEKQATDSADTSE